MEQSSLPVVFAQTAASGCPQCSQANRSREMSVHARRGRGDSSTSTPGLDRQELGGPQGLLPDPAAPDGTFAEQFTGYSDGEHT